jgi:hypothetical protein
LDTDQQIAPESHHGTKERDADRYRDPLTRRHEAGGEPCIGICDV